MSEAFGGGGWGGVMGAGEGGGCRMHGRWLGLSHSGMVNVGDQNIMSDTLVSRSGSIRPYNHGYCR